VLLLQPLLDVGNFDRVVVGRGLGNLLRYLGLRMNLNLSLKSSRLLS
jgi:hypothetical protein